MNEQGAMNLVLDEQARKTFAAGDHLFTGAQANQWLEDTSNAPRWFLVHEMQSWKNGYWALSDKQNRANSVLLIANLCWLAVTIWLILQVP